MDFFTLIGIAAALAMDAFAVALSAGVLLNPITGRQLFRLGVHFGLFQALMPLIGWAAGRGLRSTIEAYDHWIAFVLLAIVGGRMCYGAFNKSEEEPAEETAEAETAEKPAKKLHIDNLEITNVVVKVKLLPDVTSLYRFR